MYSPHKKSSKNSKSTNKMNSQKINNEDLEIDDLINNCDFRHSSSAEQNYNVSMLTKQMQIKLTKTKILLINLTSCITELAKLFILAGFNVYLYDKEIISKNDAVNNIYLSEEDRGKNRLDTIYSKLILLNSTVNIIKIKDFTKVKDYKVAIAGFSDFNDLIQYEEYFNRKSIMFYILNTSGLYGFCYHNISKKLISNFCDQTDEKFEKFVESQNSNSNNFLKKSEKFLQKEKINEKDFITISVFLMEIYYRKNVDVKNLKSVLKDELNADNKYMEKMFFIESYLKKKKLNHILENTNLLDTFRRFIINFNRELNPTCFIMAKKIFNIVFETFLNGNFPKEIMITYNSDYFDEFDYNSFI